MLSNNNVIGSDYLNALGKDSKTDWNMQKFGEDQVLSISKRYVVAKEWSWKASRKESRLVKTSVTRPLNFLVSFTRMLTHSAIFLQKSPFFLNYTLDLSEEGFLGSGSFSVCRSVCHGSNCFATCCPSTVLISMTYWDTVWSFTVFFIHIYSASSFIIRSLLRG